MKRTLNGGSEKTGGLALPVQPELGRPRIGPDTLPAPVTNAPPRPAEAAPARPHPQPDFDAIFRQRQQESLIKPEFKLLVAEIRTFLSDTRQWLNQAEAEWQQSGAAPDESMETALLLPMAQRVITAFNFQHERFEELAYQISPTDRAVHLAYVRRLWLDLFMGAPFAHRTFSKPLGYAGDYEMMNMIHRNRPEGATLYDKLIHLLLVSQWPALSVRNRIAHLKEKLIQETARASRARRRTRILNIGCGPAREAQYFVAEHSLSDQADFTLLDFNPETLKHASGRLQELIRTHYRQTRVETLNVSVLSLLRRAAKHGAVGLGGDYDVVYCAGLFDYLTEEACRELVGLFYENLRPGGLVIAANMNDSQPFRNFIEFVLDWVLIYRSSREVARFAPEDIAKHSAVVAEPSGVNIFLHLRKPE